MARENMNPNYGDGKAGATVPLLFEGQHLIRAIVAADGEPWFIGADICRALDLANPNQALSRLDDDERSTLTIAEGAPGVSEGAPGGPARVIISEAGVYRLIFTSRKEAAERFKRWLAHDVLPRIRKTGRYEEGGSPSRINTAALNAASRAIGEVRRCHGPRAAAEALPNIFAKAGIAIAPWHPPQGELGLDEKPDPSEDGS